VTAPVNKPYLYASTPENGEQNVAFAVTPVVVDIDCSTTVSNASVKVWFNGVLAYDAAGAGFQAGYTGSVATVGTRRVVTFATHPVFTVKDVVITAFAYNAAVTAYSYMSFSFSTLVGAISSLTAKTFCEGKQIDLAWVNPAGITRVKIRRSAWAYALYDSDEGDTIYDGAVKASHSDTGLAEGKFYYYTVLFSYSPGPSYVWNADDNSFVEGLSIKDYNKAEGDYVYNLLPDNYRKADQEEARGTQRYKLRDYCTVIQCSVNLYRGWLEALLLLRDAENMPAGRLGEAENQKGLISAHLAMFGVTPEQSFDAGVLRRLAMGIAVANKQKGTCNGLVTLGKLFTGWDATCKELVDPSCGVNRFVVSWDKESYILIGKNIAKTPTYTPVGWVVEVGANYLDVPTATSLYKADGITAATAPPDTSSSDQTVAMVIDEMGSWCCVSDVTTSAGKTRITFSNGLPRAEITGTGTAAGSDFTITAVDLTSYPKQFPSPAAEPVWGTNAWAGHKIIDSAGTIRTVVTSDATDAITGDTVLHLSGAVASGVFSLAFDFDPAGVTFATRKPILKARLYIGEFSPVYDPRWDTRLLSDFYAGPWSTLTGFGAPTSFGWAPTPKDVVLTFSQGYSDYGSVTRVAANELEDYTKAWTTNQWLGYYVNPNWEQKKLFKVIYNDATHLYLDMKTGTDLSSFSGTKASYVILSPENAARYAQFMRLMPTFCMFEARPVVKFL